MGTDNPDRFAEAFFAALHSSGNRTITMTQQGPGERPMDGAFLDTLGTSAAQFGFRKNCVTGRCDELSQAISSLVVSGMCFYVAPEYRVLEINLTAHEAEQILAQSGQRVFFENFAEQFWKRYRELHW
jgi:hypothetical protein